MPANANANHTHTPTRDPFPPQSERVINDINPPCSAFQVAKPQEKKKNKKGKQGNFPPADKCQWPSHAETIFVLLIVPLNSSELAVCSADKTSGFDALIYRHRCQWPARGSSFSQSVRRRLIFIRFETKKILIKRNSQETLGGRSKV